jgi:hypothetical protein
MCFDGERKNKKVSLFDSRKTEVSMNNRTVLPAICILVSMLLSGCAERWQKPGASQEDFQAMKSSCENSSRLRFPPMLRLVQNEDEHTTPITTTCSGAGAARVCSTSGGRYVPPTFSSVDDNKSARDQATRACFLENGWRPVKEN